MKIFLREYFFGLGLIYRLKHRNFYDYLKNRKYFYNLKNRFQSYQYLSNLESFYVTKNLIGMMKV